MAKGGTYAKNKQSNRNLWLLVLVLLLGASAVLLALSRENPDAQEPETTITDPTGTTAAENTVPGTSQSPLETIDQTEPDIEKSTDPTQARIPGSQPPESQIPREPADYDTVLEQYRQVLQLDPAEFMSLNFNDTDRSITLTREVLEEMYREGTLSELNALFERPALSDQYPYVPGGTLHMAKMGQKGDALDLTPYHYAFYNIDQRRSDELLIGVYDENRNEYDILAIYTMRYEEPMLLQSISDDSRWHLTVYEDGTYCVDGSGGASVHYYHYYCLHDSFDTEVNLNSFTINYDDPRAEAMSQMIKAYLSQLSPARNIPWQPLVQE